VRSVVLVDDHAMWRAGVRAELVGHVQVLAEAADVDSAVAAVREHRPDVVLLDVHLPGGGGAEVMRRAATASPGTSFLALSVSDAAEDVIATIRAGARGYVTKTITGPELVAAVERVATGDAVFSPRLVMRLIARGYSYREVAAELFISVRTVETHVSSVLRKLQLSSRHELTRWAADRRLL
jgi:DNA-binding NarL/FixJ family response regulator